VWRAMYMNSNIWCDLATKESAWRCFMVLRTFFSARHASAPSRPASSSSLPSCHCPVLVFLDIYARTLFRYDLLCLEGLSLALNVFRGKMPVPAFASIRPPTDAIQTIKVTLCFKSGPILRRRSCC
jgi:hypothetical protein